MKKLYSTVVTLVFLAMLIPAAVEAAPRHFPSWDKKLTNGRFVVLTQFGGAAVFDKETGLVWEQSPDTGTRSWFEALADCYTRELGGRSGWRLPTIEELASLLDKSQLDPSLPPGHPFINVQLLGRNYWSATTDASSGGAWVVVFSNGGAVGVSGIKSFTGHASWCVRGAQGIDGVQ